MPTIIFVFLICPSSAYDRNGNYQGQVNQQGSRSVYRDKRTTTGHYTTITYSRPNRPSIIDRRDAAGAACRSCSARRTPFALDADPTHKGALEYQGELYVELGQIDKARDNLARLDKLCWFDCDERDDLKQAIAHATGKK